MRSVRYTAAWVFRRGCVSAVALPGGTSLVTLALDRERPSWPALLYLGFALALAAGHTAIVRSAFWRSRAISQPSSFGRRSIVLGGRIAALAVGTGLYYSFDLDDRIKERAERLSVERELGKPGHRSIDTIQKARELQHCNRSMETMVFFDQFKVGDGVPTGISPGCLISQWSRISRCSTNERLRWCRLEDDHQRNRAHTTPPSRIAYQSDRQGDNEHRDQQAHSYKSRPLLLSYSSPQIDCCSTIDQHFSASVPTLVRRGWEPIDTMLEVVLIDLSDVPVDLRELVLLLQSSQFTDRVMSDVPQLVATKTKPNW